MTSPRTHVALAALLTVAIALVAAPDPLGRESALATAAAPPAPPPAGARPNIVVVMADDMRVDDLLFAPSVRRLVAARGLQFENSFSPYPLCCPARASFLTGQYAHNHRVDWHERPLGYGAFDDSRTLATSLRAAGYRTGFIGKYLNGYGRMRSRVSGKPSWRYTPRGWTDWVGALENPGGDRFHGDTYNYFDTPFNVNGRVDNRYRGRYQSNVIGDFSVQLARKYTRDAKPFFLYVNYVAPHFGGPREKDDIRAVRRSDGRLEVFKSPARPRKIRGRFDSVIKRGAGVPRGGGPLEKDVSDKPRVFAKLPEPTKRERRALRELTRQRAESIFVMDRQVRRLVRTLKKSGAWENTVFMFTSDNGYFLGEHRMRTGKVRAHEPSLRVPLVLTGPGMRSGEKRYDPITTLDLSASILDLADAGAPRSADGVTRVPTMLGGDRGWSTPVVTESAIPGKGRTFTAGRTSVGLRTARYSLILNKRGRHELYDLLRDPLQDTNVYRAASHRAVRQRLLDTLTSVKDCSGAGCRAQLPSDLRSSAVQNAALNRHYWRTVNGTYGW